MEPKKGIFILDWKFTHKPFKDAVHFKKKKKVVDYFLFGVFFVGNILNKIYFIKQKQFPSLKEKQQQQQHIWLKQNDLNHIIM